MARVVVEAKLQNRTSRERLAVRWEPYWRIISEGAHVGYYKGRRGGRWVARFRKAGASGGYAKTTLGEADDFLDADGDRILNFSQAQLAARDWFTEKSREDRHWGGADYTVGDALDDYMESFTGKSVGATTNRVESIIRPALWHLLVSSLTTKQISEWHRRRAASPAKLRTSTRATTINVREVTDEEAIRRRRSTANRDLTVLKAALNRAYRDGTVASDEAWRRVSPFKGSMPPICVT